MASTAAEIRSRIARSRVGTFFSVADYTAEKRVAAETAFSRLASEGKVLRVRRGLYWKGAKSRFGPGRPTPEAIARKVAEGRGFGPTGWSASSALGLTTQVPARPAFVVVGPVPTGLEGVDIRSRSNLGRVRFDLSFLEIAFLELLRSYPRYVDLDWDELRKRVVVLASDGRLRLDRVARAADSERSPRVSQLVRELGDGLRTAA
jgi:hypothetical protein